ncbi:MAG TPA: hypothetical protein VKN18_01025 [Blastocatellia bacterium]|nr:hypothetical protein [Blastocatellia bacterium]
MRVTRRELLRVAGVFAGAVLLGDMGVIGATKRTMNRRRAMTATRGSDSGPLSGTNLYEDVITYYNLGEHKTATEGDLKTSQWLLEQLRGAGLKATFQSFSLRQFFVRQTKLTVADRNIRAVPLWFPRSTGTVPITGTLVSLEMTHEPGSLRGKFALVKFPADAGGAVVEGSIHSKLIRAAATAGASAVIAISEGPTKEIVALNSPAGSEPWPIPVVLTGQRDEPYLADAVKSGAKVTLLLEGDDDKDTKAKNVIGRVDRGGKDLIVVSTPQSGWFRCAAERGPGIALFLGLARWANRRPSGASFLFVSTSGHEIGGLGMQAFLKDLAPTTDRVLCWLHLGAGIASYAWEETQSGPRRLQEPDSRRLLMTTPGLVPLLTTTFAGQSGLTPTVGRAVGEFELILKGGYTGFGIAAAHRFHHTPADSPEMTGPEIIEPVGRALVNTLETLHQTPRG